MHELPVTQNILEIALRHANDSGAKQIITIYLVIGELTSFIDDSIAFYWEIITKETIAEGAKIVIRRIPVELECSLCQRKYIPKTDSYECPNCSGTQSRIITGKEFYLEAIEVE